MSEAEDKFRAVIKQALIDAVVYKDPKWEVSYSEALDSYTNAVVGSLKLDEWFISRDSIFEVLESDFEGSYDDDPPYTGYMVYVYEDLEEHDE